MDLHSGRKVSLARETFLPLIAPLSLNSIAYLNSRNYF